MNCSRFVATAALLACALGQAGPARAYPGGTPRNVTNAGPFCARCHSSADAEQLRDLPAQAQAMMLPDKKHYAAILAGEDNYGKLSEADRGKLLEAIKAVDANSKVTLAASSLKLKRGGALTVTVNTRGGAGPVVGVMLTDTDLRNEAGPVQGEGFYISRAPEIYGQDGKIQTKWLDGRFPGLSKNLNYVNIQDVKSDPSANSYAECKVVYTMRAPMDPGEYTISAAFLYGTEKSTALGRVQTPDGRVIPVGGGGADSGRIQFARTIKITVL